MKAWILSDKTGHNHYSNLVWAKSAGKAKMQANKDGYFAYQTNLEIDDWRDIAARRMKAFDDCENLSEKEICLRLIKDHGWWFEFDGERYDEDNIDEFREMF